MEVKVMQWPVLVRATVRMEGGCQQPNETNSYRRGTVRCALMLSTAVRTLLQSYLSGELKTADVSTKNLLTGPTE
jgi:hypothetical protein